MRKEFHIEGSIQGTLIKHAKKVTYGGRNTFRVHKLSVKAFIKAITELGGEKYDVWPENHGEGSEYSMILKYTSVTFNPSKKEVYFINLSEPKRKK